MAAPFTFGFGDDSDGDDPAPSPPAPAPAEGLQQPPRLLNFRELLAALPSNIAYGTLEIEAPNGRKLGIPRRELFDVRVQLMAEDSGEDPDVLAGLDSSDIKTNVYEGGFKTWECSIDLARLLLARGPRKDLDDLYRVHHVLEMGCGTAIPSLVLFQHALAENLSMEFTVADYNSSVLRLVTLPNLLLTWVKSRPDPQSHPFSPEEPNPLHSQTAGDLAITPALVDSFVNSLKQQSLNLRVISGSWAPAEPFLSLLPLCPEVDTVVLASETIYSPASLSSFAEALVGILSRTGMSKAMISAKQIYFGVGGGVDAFKEAASARGAIVCDVNDSGLDLRAGGVKRCLMEAQMM